MRFTTKEIKKNSSNTGNLYKQRKRKEKKRNVRNWIIIRDNADNQTEENKSLRGGKGEKEEGK